MASPAAAPTAFVEVRFARNMSGVHDTINAGLRVTRRPGPMCTFAILPDVGAEFHGLRMGEAASDAVPVAGLLGRLVLRVVRRGRGGSLEQA